MTEPRAAIRILVVEDSLTQRAHLARVLERAGETTVVAHAASVGEAVAAVAEHKPDFITMDLELPGAGEGEYGGVEAIRRIMAQHPTPILVLSVHASSRGDSPAIEALAAGAVDVFPKNDLASASRIEELHRRIRVIAGVPVVARWPRPPDPPPENAPRPRGARPVIALAASTGGPGALRTLVQELRGVPCPILLVQHIHPEFVSSFVRWLEDETLVPAVVAQDGQRAQPGVVHVAPGDCHLRLTAGQLLEVSAEPALPSMPSANELLMSVARYAGARAIAAVLTGMGVDGAQGLLAVREQGGRTFAQDAESSIVDGMPRAARTLGAAEWVLGAGEIGTAIAGLARGERQR